MQGDQEPVEHKEAGDVNLTEIAHNEFFQAIREKTKSTVGIEVAAVSALTVIMGREAIYQRRMVTWDEMGVSV